MQFLKVVSRRRNESLLPMLTPRYSPQKGLPAVFVINDRGNCDVWVKSMECENCSEDVTHPIGFENTMLLTSSLGLLLVRNCCETTRGNRVVDDDESSIAQDPERIHDITIRLLERMQAIDEDDIKICGWPTGIIKAFAEEIVRPHAVILDVGWQVEEIHAVPRINTDDGLCSH